METIRVFALVRNAGGEPDIVFRDLEFNQDEYDNGEHYEKIEEIVTEEGFEFVGAFDQYDPAASRVNDLRTF